MSIIQGLCRMELPAAQGTEGREPFYQRLFILVALQMKGSTYFSAIRRSVLSEARISSSERPTSSPLSSTPI